jgi:hypothetical protein
VSARRHEAGKCGDVDKEPKRGIDTGRTAAGRPVRSIRKNNVLPGSGPTDLHFGKNDLVPRTQARPAHVPPWPSDQDPSVPGQLGGPPSSESLTHVGKE